MILRVQSAIVLSCLRLKHSDDKTFLAIFLIESLMKFHYFHGYNISELAYHLSYPSSSAFITTVVYVIHLVR